MFTRPESLCKVNGGECPLVLASGVAGDFCGHPDAVLGLKAGKHPSSGLRRWWRVSKGHSEYNQASEEFCC